MATFRDAPAQWEGSPVVHLVTNSVWQRSAKFARCGAKIGPNAHYDGGLVPSCPACIAGVARRDAADTTGDN